MQAEPTREAALHEARKALRCLYLAVSEDVARDVGQKVEAAFAAIDAEAGRRVRERDREWANAAGGHVDSYAKTCKDTPEKLAGYLEAAAEIDQQVTENLMHAAVVAVLRAQAAHCLNCDVAMEEVVFALDRLAGRPVGTLLKEVRGE